MRGLAYHSSTYRIYSCESDKIYEMNPNNASPTQVAQVSGGKTLRYVSVPPFAEESEGKSLWALTDTSMVISVDLDDGSDVDLFPTGSAESEPYGAIAVGPNGEVVTVRGSDSRICAGLFSLSLSPISFFSFLNMCVYPTDYGHEIPRG